MKKFLKFLGFGFLALVVLGIFANMGDDSGSDTASTTTEEEVKAEGNSDAKAEKKEVETVGVGTEVEVGKLAYKVNGVEEMSEIKAEYMDTLTTSGKFIIVDMTIKNNDKEARFVDTEMFRLVDADGTEFSTKSEADMYINESDLGFFLSEINPKMDKTGKVAFEVPADATDLQLQVSSGFGWSGGKYKNINLK